RLQSNPLLASSYLFWRRVPRKTTIYWMTSPQTLPAAGNLTNEDELYWLALRMVPGLGTRRIGLLLERMPTPRAIFRASPSELEGAGLPGALARSISSGCSFDDAASQQQKLRQAGAQIVTLGDSRYP